MKSRYQGMTKAETRAWKKDISYAEKLKDFIEEYEGETMKRCFDDTNCEYEKAGKVIQCGDCGFYKELKSCNLTTPTKKLWYDLEKQVLVFEIKFGDITFHYTCSMYQCMFPENTSFIQRDLENRLRDFLEVVCE